MNGWKYYQKWAYRKSALNLKIWHICTHHFCNYLYIHYDHPHVTVIQDITTYMTTMEFHKIISTLHIAIDQLDYLFPQGHSFLWFPIALHSQTSAGVMKVHQIRYQWWMESDTTQLPSFEISCTNGYMGLKYYLIIFTRSGQLPASTQLRCHGLFWHCYLAQSGYLQVTGCEHQRR